MCFTRFQVFETRFIEDKISRAMAVIPVIGLVVSLFTCDAYNVCSGRQRWLLSNRQKSGNKNRAMVHENEYEPEAVETNHLILL